MGKVDSQPWVLVYTLPATPYLVAPVLHKIPPVLLFHSLYQRAYYHHVGQRLVYQQSYLKHFFHRLQYARLVQSVSRVEQLSHLRVCANATQFPQPRP